MGGVVVGTLAGLGGRGDPLVMLDAAGGESVPARSVVQWGAADVGREVVLQFERGDVSKPIIMGFLQTGPRGESDLPDALGAEADGERLVLSADKEIVLRCGAASITLTRAGKVLIRGTYLLSRSTGANHIKGGSVQIN